MAEVSPNKLADLIDQQIRLSGPMPLHHYMQLCLNHPEHGYYTTGKPLGADGDFITAPEISQVFGELIGLWLGAAWQQMGSPKRFALAELGPGRGTLMRDAMRATQRLSGFHEAMQLCLLESNAHLRTLQQDALGGFEPAFIREIEELPTDVPLLIIANEFFDALPMRQFQKMDDGWHEREIGLKDGKRALGLSPTPYDAVLLPPALTNAETNSVWEFGELAQKVMTNIAGRIASQGGALLAIDYGYAQTQTGETFQALEKHKFADPLANPGKADLTAHVDFEAIAGAANAAGAQTFPLATQGDFLKAMGVAERAGTLARANPDQAKEVIGAIERLVAPDKMGTLFKVLCVAAPGFTPYPFGGQ